MGTSSLHVNRDIILATKKQRMKERQKQTPMEAMLALAQMQRRPRPLLSYSGDGDEMTIIAQITRTEVYDPVTTALHCVEEGANAIAFFTDHSIYDNDLDDMLMVARALQDMPVLYQNYATTPYDVMAARAADASAMVSYSSLMDTQTMRSVTSMAQRWKMSTIVQVNTAEDLEFALTLSPHALAFGDHLSGRIDQTVEALRGVRRHLPTYCRVMLMHTLYSYKDVALALTADVDAVIVSPNLLRTERSARKLREMVNGTDPTS